MKNNSVLLLICCLFFVCLTSIQAQREVRITPNGISNGGNETPNSSEIEFQEGSFAAEIDLNSSGALQLGTGANPLSGITINVSNEVGIGTTSPQDKLHVMGDLRIQDGTNPQINFYNSSGSDIGYLRGNINDMILSNTVENIGRIFYQAENGHEFQTKSGGSNVTRMFISSNGNVGIGTTNPLEKMHIINGDLRVDNGEIQSWGPIILHPDVDGSGDDIVQFLNTAGGETARIHNNGSVGIGTTAPTGKLDVNGNMRVRGLLDIDHKDAPAFGQMTGVDLGLNGILIENRFSESAGFHADGDMATIWSPGDDKLLRVFDEDGGASGLRWYLDSDGDAFKASDANLKKDVKTLERSLEKLQQLRGVSFTWKKSSEELAKGDMETPSIGVIAQELEQVFPELVGTNQTGRKFVDYDGLAPILIEAVKEQQVLIEERDEKIEALEERLAKIEALLQGQSTINNPNINNSTTTLSSARLEQNQPNPFDGSTVVRYFIPEGVKKAELRITNLQGKVIKSVAIQARGEGQITFDATTLGSGTYQYSLFVDGQPLDTKQMILTRN